MRKPVKQYALPPSQLERALRDLGLSRREAAHVMARGLFDAPPPVAIAAVERTLDDLGLSPRDARAFMARGKSGLQRNPNSLRAGRAGTRRTVGPCRTARPQVPESADGSASGTLALRRRVGVSATLIATDCRSRRDAGDGFGSS